MSATVAPPPPYPSVQLFISIPFSHLYFLPPCVLLPLPLCISDPPFVVSNVRCDHKASWLGSIHALNGFYPVSIRPGHYGLTSCAVALRYLKEWYARYACSSTPTVLHACSDTNGARMTPMAPGHAHPRIGKERGIAKTGMSSKQGIAWSDPKHTKRKQHSCKEMYKQSSRLHGISSDNPSGRLYFHGRRRRCHFLLVGDRRRGLEYLNTVLANQLQWHQAGKEPQQGKHQRRQLDMRPSGHRTTTRQQQQEISKREFRVSIHTDCQEHPVEKQ